MNLTRAAIEKNRITVVALLLVLLGGLWTFFNLPRDYDPGFIIRIARVVTYFPGAGPERVEQLVTDKLEKVIQEIPEIDFIESESKTGVSIIMVNILPEYTEMRPIWDDLRRKVAKATPDLPEGIIGPLVNDEFGDVFGIVVAITGEGYSYAELKDVADNVRDEFLRLEDVAKVDIYGEQEERIFMDYHNSKLAEIGLSPYNLMRMIESRNIIVSGGDLTIGPERITLEPTGNFDDIEALKQTIINIPQRPGGVYLGDVVHIYRGYIDPPRSKMRATGRPSLGLAVSMREGGNLIDLGKQVNHLIQQLQSRYPYGIEFEKINFLPEEVDNKVVEFRNNLLQAIGVVMLVMMIAMGMKTGLMVATLIPMSMLMAFLAMFYFDIGLNQVSLAALIIALGMLVDNAIVMTESVMVQVQEGVDGIEAAVNSSKELVIPLLTSSLTTAAAFLPIYLAESETGEYTAPLFEVVTITLLCSWILALTMIPLFCAKGIKPKPQKENQSGYDSIFYRAYRGILIWMLKNRWTTVLVVITVFTGAMWAMKFLPVIFFPPSDRMYFKAEFEYPEGYSIETTEQTMIDIEVFLKKELAAGPDRSEGVTHWGVYIGEGGPRFILSHSPEPGTPGYALFVIHTTSAQIIDAMIERLDRYVTENFPDLVSRITRMQNGPPLKYPVEIRIMGKEIDVIFDIVNKLKEQLTRIDGTKNIKDDWGLRTKKIVVDIDQPRAQRAGVTNQDIALSLQTYLSGFEVSEYREGDKIIPITLRSAAAERMDIGKLESLNVFVQSTGQSVPLKQVADIRLEWQPAKILRKERFRSVTVSSEVFPHITADEVNRNIVPWLKKQSENWEVGYRFELGGEAEESGKANQSIMEKLPIAGFIIVMLLVAQFNSIRRPFIILATIPLGFIGVIIGLLLARLYFGFMTLLGIISLSGIVINNAIVLLERIKLEIEENGLEENRAIIEAGQRRFRPILLTTATTVFGMLPLYLGGGAMWEPMAMAIIAGLIFSTALTLGVIPVLYALLFGIRFKDFKY